LFRKNSAADFRAIGERADYSQVSVFVQILHEPLTANRKAEGAGSVLGRLHGCVRDLPREPLRLTR
jgi:hypothetical protein